MFVFPSWLLLFLFCDCKESQTFSYDIGGINLFTTYVIEGISFYTFFFRGFVNNMKRNVIENQDGMLRDEIIWM